MTREGTGGQYGLPDPNHGLDEADSEAIVEIRTEIEETRLEMGDTLTELGDRLEPGHLVEQAKQNVRDATIGRVEETAKGVSDMVVETIKRNPIPAALAGAGLALLWANRSSGNGNGHHTDMRSRYGSSDQYGYSRQGQRSGSTGGFDPSRIGDVASDVGQNVGQAIGGVGENVGQVAGDVVQQGRQAIDEVGWRLDRFMQASPLAMGAIAAGAGAVIGALIPETPQEREWLGDASREIGSTVRDTVQQVTTKAEEQIDKVEERLPAGSR